MNDALPVFGWVDWALLAVLAVSVVVGLWRGLVFEVLSLVGWVVAFFAAQAFAPFAAAYVPVGVPRQSGHIYLVTNRHGQHRLVVLALPVITGEMHGLLTTLQAGRGAHLAPVATPIVLRPIDPAERADFGRIGRGHRAHAAYAALLARTIDGHFASLLLA